MNEDDRKYKKLRRSYLDSMESANICRVQANILKQRGRPVGAWLMQRCAGAYDLIANWEKHLIKIWKRSRDNKQD